MTAPVVAVSIPASNTLAEHWGGGWLTAVGVEAAEVHAKGAASDEALLRKVVEDGRVIVLPAV